MNIDSKDLLYAVSGTFSTMKIILAKIRKIDSKNKQGSSGKHFDYKSAVQSVKKPSVLDKSSKETKKLENEAIFAFCQSSDQSKPERYRTSCSRYSR